ncbi:MAG: 16S rRNA (cytosine(1402)-N(4))-methyltransferase RsmH [Acutalibacteraceae bacterium]|nr:16S rRNA (cytosine(1402)-N(4))-methyltransferase RsmH [Acutalibacteraceae bacterium]
MEFNHYSVLLSETIEALSVKPDGIYVDGTAGGAGHSKKIAEKLTSGMLYALDQDPDAVNVATSRLEGLRAKVIKSNFKDMKEVLLKENVEKVDGILLDLGVSSYQLDEGSRGFSYHKEAFLDMRMSQEGITAADIVATYSANDLAKIFFEYGEEKFSYRIANAIVKEREITPIKTTTQLAEIIAKSVPAAARRDGHPARRVFQALRIAVNGELDVLKEVLDSAFDLLNEGGVLAIITFHSIEDSIVKHKFKEFASGCTCPPDLPVCVCGKTPRGKIIHKKGIEPSKEEIEINNRSRSAKLRTIIKI